MSPMSRRRSAVVSHAALSRREREIMDVIYRLGTASVGEVVRKLADAPSYSSVRTMLGRLEQKGHLKHTQRGTQYIYAAVLARTHARDSAVRRVIATFFDGSPTKLVSAVLDRSVRNLSAEELDEIQAMIARARREVRDA